MASVLHSDNVIVDVQNKLQDVRNPMAAMMVLLREMDLETDSEVGGDGLVAPGNTLSVNESATPLSVASVCPARCLAGQSLNLRIGLSQLYSGSTAVSVVSQAVCHMAMTRALFCRDLLILQKLYLRFGDNVRVHTHTHTVTCLVMMGRENSLLTGRGLGLSV